VQKHVAILQEAGLVEKEARGRRRLVHGQPDRLNRASALLTQMEGLWRERGRQLDDLLARPGTQKFDAHHPRDSRSARKSTRLNSTRVSSSCAGFCSKRENHIR